jgi:hypothetical protein
MKLANYWNYLDGAFHASYGGIFLREFFCRFFDVAGGMIESQLNRARTKAGKICPGGMIFLSKSS